MNISTAEVEVFKQQFAIPCLKSEAVRSFLSKGNGRLTRTHVKTLEDVKLRARQAQMELQYLRDKTFPVVLDGLVDLMSIAHKGRKERVRMAKLSNASLATEQSEYGRKCSSTPAQDSGANMGHMEAAGSSTDSSTPVRKQTIPATTRKRRQVFDDSDDEDSIAREEVRGTTATSTSTTLTTVPEVGQDARPPSSS
jgi:hypothetical protein